MKLIAPNWRQLWKSYSMWAAGVGMILPDLLNLLADNISGFPWFDDGYKSIIRTVCLALVILLRLVHQPALHRDEDKP